MTSTTTTSEHAAHARPTTAADPRRPPGITPTRERMLTGDRPTGRLHLGHLVGSIDNRVRLQHRYETFLLIADVHMLTTKNTRADIEQVAVNARTMVLDQLGAGIDPEVVTFYLQSAIPEVNDLAVLLQNLVTVPRLQRVPSLKDMARAAGREEVPFGLLGYPVLQAADILGVKGGVVPVGKDNHAHVEVTREIARRFNNLYGEVFPVPDTVESKVTTLIGTDGTAKMSKALGNAIYLSDDAETVRRRVARMYTDPTRLRADRPGRVEGNPVFDFHRAYNDDLSEVADLEERYRRGTVGDVEVKTALAAALNRHLEPMRDRRAQFAGRPGLVDEIVVDGTERTRAIVREVVAEARSAMGITDSFARLRRGADRSRRRPRLV